MAEGYDPTIGILHGRESERGTYPAFVPRDVTPLACGLLITECFHGREARCISRGQVCRSRDDCNHD